MLIYLAISALAVFVLAFVVLTLGEPSLLAMAHLIFTAAILPLIFGAITHFVPVLTRSGPAHRAVMVVPLLLQVTGLVAFLHFFGEVGAGALNAAAGIGLLVSIGFAGWLIFRARRTFGKPHPGWRWYLAAVVFLVVGIALVPAMSIWPAWRHELRLLHLHLNTLGFIGLTAIGTLQVLLPTVLSGPDAEAAARLRRDLLPAAGGVLACGFGAAFWWPLSLLGTGLLAFVAVRLGLSWLRRYGWRKIIGDGASAALAGALCGYLALLGLGVAHGLGVLSGHDAVPAFITAFLLPLVTGALSQLLPVWLYPGRRTAQRDRMRAQLVVGGALRALLFISGGSLLAMGFREGIWPTAAGLMFFLYVLVCGSRIPKV